MEKTRDNDEKTSQDVKAMNIDFDDTLYFAKQLRMLNQQVDDLRHTMYIDSLIGDKVSKQNIKRKIIKEDQQLINEKVQMQFAHYEDKIFGLRSEIQMLHHALQNLENKIQQILQKI